MKKQFGVLTTLPAPPANLPEDAREVWTHVCSYLLNREILHYGDLPTVEAFSWAMARLRRLEAVLDQEGPITEAGRIHPALAAANGTAASCSKLANALGLAPIARARLNVSVQKGAEKPDAAEAEWAAVLPMKGRRK